MGIVPGGAVTPNDKGRVVPLQFNVKSKEVVWVAGTVTDKLALVALPMPVKAVAIEPPVTEQVAALKPVVVQVNEVGVAIPLVPELALPVVYPKLSIELTTACAAGHDSVQVDVVVTLGICPGRVTSQLTVCRASAG